MQNYQNEYKNLRNAHVAGVNSHIEILDKMIQDIQYLEGLMGEVYYDFSEEEIKNEPKSVQKIWNMGKAITNRFSVGIDIGATAKAYPNIIRDELDKDNEKGI